MTSNFFFYLFVLLFYKFYILRLISASGYGRSESTVILFLQRAQDAKRSYGSILFCDSFYFGCHSSSILGYTEDILKQALENIYEKNNFTNKTSELAFMEMNASGIKVS